MFVEVTDKKLIGGTFLGPLIGGGRGGGGLYSFIIIVILLKGGNKASISLRKCKLIVLGGEGDISHSPIMVHPTFFP